jgi:hypothetical protein
MRSDAALMRAARKDPAAFQELYERYAACIYVRAGRERLARLDAGKSCCMLYLAN